MVELVLGSLTGMVVHILNFEEFRYRFDWLCLVDKLDGSELHLQIEVC